jgi:hypothetical protein
VREDLVRFDTEFKGWALDSIGPLLSNFRAQTGDRTWR